MAGPFTYPTASSIFFDKEGTTFTSEDVRSAILEALAQAIQNDRYAAFGNGGGNNNAGTFLSWSPAGSSDSVPFLIPVESTLRAITLVTSANTTGEIGIYKNGATADGQEIAIIAFNNQRKGFFTFPDVGQAGEVRLNAQDEVHIRIKSGSFSKPSVVMFLSTVSGGL